MVNDEPTLRRLGGPGGRRLLSLEAPRVPGSCQVVPGATKSGGLHQQKSWDFTSKNHGISEDFRGFQHQT